MSKVAVVYWSGTGNTEAMANAVADGARRAGATVDVFSVGDFSADKVSGYDALAWGCSAQGDEVLEEYDFEPKFDECASAMSGKKVALFGSYGWGDGQWMRDWEADAQANGVTLACESVICNEAPDDDAKPSACAGRTSISRTIPSTSSGISTLWAPLPKTAP